MTRGQRQTGSGHLKKERGPRKYYRGSIAGGLEKRPAGLVAQRSLLRSILTP